MSSKAELQTALKERYGINKNISQPLTTEQCEQLLRVLEIEPSTAKLVEAFVEKNASLGQNNLELGRRRSIAEKRLESLQRNYDRLEASLVDSASDRTQELEQKTQQLEKKIKELTQVNDELKKDNKGLKNIVDALKLGTVTDIGKILRLEDSQIRKALMRWVARNFE